MKCANCHREIDADMNFCPNCGSTVKASASDAFVSAEAAIRSLPLCSVPGCGYHLIDSSMLGSAGELVSFAVGADIWQKLSQGEKMALESAKALKVSSEQVHFPMWQYGDESVWTVCPNGCRICRYHRTEEDWPKSRIDIEEYILRNHRYTCPACKKEWVVAEVSNAADSTVLAFTDVSWQYNDSESNKRYRNNCIHLIVTKPSIGEYHAINRQVNAWHVIPEQLSLQPFGRKLNTLTRHSGFVGQTAFSPDGRLLASGSSDGTVIVWNLATGQPEFPPFASEHYWPTCLVFSPDGTRLLATWTDRLVVWRLRDGKKVKDAKLQSNRRWHTVAPDSRVDTLACAQYSTIVEVHTDSGRSGRSFRGHEAEIVAVRISPDDQFMATSDFDGRVVIWDYRSGTKLHDFRAHEDMVFDLAFNPTASLLATGAFDNTVKVWNVKNGNLVAHLHGNFMHIFEVAFSPDGSSLISGSDDHTLNLWSIRQASNGLDDVINYTPIPAPSPLGGFIPMYVAGRHMSHDYDSALSIDHLGKRLAYATQDYSIHVWELGSTPP